ncbi:glycosyltransferase family 9 protein [Herbaspirillum sp. YR522]|uniref:glycosyltransferase family 9 protein n=1 Tax=Herbaspirillum sp. YR522 TaxID=1144342 RepID=UPI00026F4B20|nr:glycosyltransferase family 9 protein [Herbaspirillum sp. YR522]EJM97461.1 ADP-heptose:LPS heptosyltransferase [Herbaspirillum sp. YR522]
MTDEMNGADFAAHQQRMADAFSAGQFEHCERMARALIDAGYATLPIWRTLGLSLRQQGHVMSARDIQQRLVDSAPGNVDLRFDLAETLLLLGDFERGWQHYQYRYSLGHTRHMDRKIKAPPWNGQHMPGKTLLIHDEQGYGDTFQFIRLVERARRQSQARIVVQIQPEQAAFARRLPEIDVVVPQGQLPPPFDAHCQMMSLPRALGLRLEELPGSVPYLQADPTRVQRWRQRLHQLRRPWVALAWAGRPTHDNDRNRSMTLEQLSPLAPMAARGISLISVQKGPAAAQAIKPPAGLRLEVLGDELMDFDDTAAVLQLCDLLISVDSSPVHLAGALGRPTWVMLPMVPDWRWLLEREESPWYPGTRLFRQSTRGHWDDVVARVAEQLHRFVA